MNKFKRDSDFVTFGTPEKQVNINKLKQNNINIFNDNKQNISCNIDLQNISKHIQAQTISSQKQILQTFDILEDKLQQLRQQKQYWKKIYQQQLDALQNIKNKKQSQQDKQIFKLITSMKKMYKTINRKQQEFPEVMNWIISLIQDYQDIKMNSLKWKEAYFFLYGTN